MKKKRKKNNKKREKKLCISTKKTSIQKRRTCIKWRKQTSLPWAARWAGFAQTAERKQTLDVRNYKESPVAPMTGCNPGPCKVPGCKLSSCEERQLSFDILMLQHSETCKSNLLLPKGKHQQWQECLLCTSKLPGWLQTGNKDNERFGVLRTPPQDSNAKTHSISKVQPV